MRKRTARKILLNIRRYTNTWYHPGKDMYIDMPKDGRSWQLIQKASIRMKHPEFIEMMAGEVRRALDKEEQE